jgi:hypothetical protein
LHDAPDVAACDPGGVAQRFRSSLLRGVLDPVEKTFTSTNSSFETVAVWDVDVSEHQTVDATFNAVLSINVTAGVGFYEYRVRAEEVNKATCLVIGQSSNSAVRFTPPEILVEGLTFTWDKDVPSFLRFVLEMRKVAGTSASITVSLRENDSFMTMEWDALRTLRLQQIAYEAVKRVQDIAGIADARIVRAPIEEQQVYPAVHLVDAGYEDRQSVLLGDGPNSRQASAILIFKLYTNQGDPLFDPIRLADKLVAAVEGGVKSLGLDYVNRVESSDLVPLKADFESHKLWGIAAQAFRIEYRSARGEL